MTSGKDVLARIKPVLRTETTEICLRPDLLDEWQRLNQELGTAAVAGTRLANPSEGKADQKATAKRLAEVEAEIDETKAHFTFQALPIHRYRALCDSRPPRKGDELDHLVGYNRDSVLDAMVRECMVDPVFDDCDADGCSHGDCGTWQNFIRVCNPGEWNELRDTVNSVNRGVVESPKSLLASRILGKQGAASK